MAYQLIFIVSLMGLHSAHPLSETKPDHLSPICNGKKCPRGYSSFCPRNAPTRCRPCVEGTFSTHHSRKQACRPCSPCGDNEFELRSCDSTSNVVCKKCSQCPPGFQVKKPCERRRDTVCEKCRVPVGLGDVSGIDCNNRGPQVTDDASVFKRRKKGKEKAKDSSPVTVIDVEKPWSSATRKSKHREREKEKPSPGFQEVLPTPSNGFAASMRFVTSHSLTISRFVEVVTRSALETEKSINPSPTLAISTEYLSVFNPTTKSESDTNAKKPSTHVDIMQGDRPNVPRHTRRNAEHNETTKAISFPPHKLSSSLPSNGVKTKNVFSRPEERTTEFSRKPGDNVKMLHPKNEDTRRSKPPWFWAVVAVTIIVAAVFVFIGVSRRRTKGCVFDCHSRFRPRRPSCPGSSDCCDGNSVPSIVETYAVQTDGIPASVKNMQEAEDLPNSNETTLVTYLQTQVTADVHRCTVFDVFPAIREPGHSTAYPQFITRADATFDSTGGKLSAPDSNVSINVESGAVPDGVFQPFFFGVVYDDTLLLKDIPETPESSLICPVIQCGPEDINLLKPVELVLPHCLYVDEVKKASISVYRCEQFSDKGPINWDKVPSVSEKNCQSKAWFTVKKNTIHIKTKTFSFWSVFTCGGPKRKRATVFVSRPNPQKDPLYLRFYIYSDNEDSKKRMERKEKDQFPDSKQAIEKPFKMYNDSKDITVWLNPEDLTKNGWELDQTPAKQTYLYDMAYKNGYRSYASCDFAVKPIVPSQASVNDFSCNLNFQQDDHPEHFIYVNPGIPLVKQNIRRFSVESNNNNNRNNLTSGATSEHRDTEPTQESPFTEIDNEEELGQDDELVTQDHCLRICCDVGADWKPVLRRFGMNETIIKNLEEDFKHCKVSEKCYQGLLEWVKIVGTENATTRALCEALRLEECHKALETLSKADVGRRPLTFVPESTADLGTSSCV